MGSPLPDPVGSLLIIKLSSAGDVLLSTPLLRALREQFPGAEITFLTGEASAPVLQGNPDTDRILVHAGRSGILTPFKKLRSFFHLAGLLRRERFDLVLDLQGLTRSWIFARLARARFRAGKGRFPGLDLRDPHRRGAVRHAVPGYCSFMGLLGYPAVRPDAMRLRMAPLPCPPDIPMPERAVLCNPFTRGRRKRWPQGYWITLGRMLVSEGHVPVFAGAPGDAPVSRRLAGAVGGGSFSVAGRVSFSGLAGVIGTAAAVISVDSAPMHMAAALGVPVVGIFGPTDPDRTGPWADKAVVAGRGPVEKGVPMSRIVPQAVMKAFREFGSSAD